MDLCKDGFGKEDIVDDLDIVDGLGIVDGKDIAHVVDGLDLVLVNFARSLDSDRKDLEVGFHLGPLLIFFDRERWGYGV